MRKEDVNIPYGEIEKKLFLAEKDIEAQIEFFDDNNLVIKSSVDGSDIETSNNDKNIIVMELRNKLRGIKLAKRIIEKVALTGADSERVMTNEEKTIFYKMVNFVGKIRKMFNFKK